MPFKSKAQLKYFFKHHPDMAKEFLGKMTRRDVESLPDKLSKPKKMKDIKHEAMEERIAKGM